MANKILVVGPSWIGDMVMAQSLFMTLKSNDRHRQIDVLAPTWSFPLLERMPEVTKAIAMPLTHGQFGFIKRMQLGKKLQAAQYDQAIVLPNSWKSALIPFFAKIPLRTGYLGEMRWGLLNDARKLDKQILTMTVQRFVSLGLPMTRRLSEKRESTAGKLILARFSDYFRRRAGYSPQKIEKSDSKQLSLATTSILRQPPSKQPPEYPIPVLELDKNKQQAVVEKFAANQAAKVLALCPGAEYGPAKRWPAEHFAELAKQKITQGWTVWLFGSEKDQPVAEQINQITANACQDFSGKTTLAEAVDLMSLADVVVTNDSGLMHVAAALQKKIIAIYGSSDPGFTPPLNSEAKVIDLELECSPCFKRDCPLGHTHCLTQISVQQVLSQIH